MISYWQFCASRVHGRYGRLDRRASMAEYALLVALVAVVCLGALALLSQDPSLHVGPIGWPA